MTELVHSLKEAHDYTRLYRDQTFVVKLGGEVLASPKVLGNLAIQVALLESLSLRLVLVHGGGPQASELSRRMGIEPEIVAGRRVTSAEALEVCKGLVDVDHFIQCIGAEKRFAPIQHWHSLARPLSPFLVRGEG